ncbi:flippase [bacterium]|nr:flippase [bacterium]
MKQLYRNIGFVGVSQFLYTGLAFVLVPFVARYLHSEGYGLYNVATILGFYLGLMNDLGVSTLITREISKSKLIAARLVAEAMMLKSLLTIFASLIIYFYVRFSRMDGPATQAVFIFCIASIISSYANSMIAVFRGFQKMELEALATLIDKLTSVILGIFFLAQGYGIRTFLFSFVVSESIKTGVCYYLLRRTLRPFHFSFHVRRASIILKKSVPFGLTVFLAVCYNYLAVLLLHSLTTLEEVGFYTAGLKLLSLTAILPTVLATAFLPQLTQARAKPEALTKIFSSGLKYLLFFSIPLIPFISLYADTLIHILFGAGFEPSVPAMRILVWASFAQMANTYFVALYIAADEQKVIVKLQIVALCLSLPLNWLFIRSFGFLGASVITVITEWGILLSILIHSRRHVLTFPGFYRKLAPFMLRIFSAALIAFLIAAWLKPKDAVHLIYPVGSVLVYLITVLLVGGNDTLLFYGKLAARLRSITAGFSR